MFAESICFDQNGDRHATATLSRQYFTSGAYFWSLSVRARSLFGFKTWANCGAGEAERPGCVCSPLVKKPQDSALKTFRILGQHPECHATAQQGHTRLTNNSCAATKTHEMAPLLCDVVGCINSAELAANPLFVSVFRSIFERGRHFWVSLRAALSIRVEPLLGVTQSHCYCGICDDATHPSREKARFLISGYPARKLSPKDGGRSFHWDADAKRYHAWRHAIVRIRYLFSGRTEHAELFGWFRGCHEMHKRVFFQRYIDYSRHIRHKLADAKIIELGI